MSRIPNSPPASDSAIVYLFNSNTLRDWWSDQPLDTAIADIIADAAEEDIELDEDDVRSALLEAAEIDAVAQEPWISTEHRSALQAAGRQTGQA